MADKVHVVVTESRKRKDLKGKDVVEFKLDVQIGTKIWSVWKRFSAFLDLHKNAMSKLDLSLATQIPPKLFFHPPEAIEARRKALQTYIQMVVEKPVLMNTWDLQYFLEMKQHMGNPIKKKILIPLPDRDFDPTEVSVPWHLFITEGWEVVFSTEEALIRPSADDVTCNPPTLLGVLGADIEALEFYRAMQEDPSFNSPLKWKDLKMSEYDAILLPGGHAPGMKQYLESSILQQKIAEFWGLDRPVAAICHGVLLLARTKNSEGKSVIHDKHTTSLPRYMENSAYYVSRLKLGERYRTYPKYCEDEIRENLDNSLHFETGPTNVLYGTAHDSSPCFAVTDGRYLSARWPGDAYFFARRLIELLYHQHEQQNPQQQ